MFDSHAAGLITEDLGSSVATVRMLTKHNVIAHVAVWPGCRD